MPIVEPYGRSRDLVNHVSAYQSPVKLHDLYDEGMCKAISSMLRGMTRLWYKNLKKQSIGSLKEESGFSSPFSSRRAQRKSSMITLTIKQRKGVSLCEYMRRFTNESLKIGNLDKMDASNHSFRERSK